MMVIVRRLMQMVLILCVLSFVLFGLLSAMPGDPVDMLITSNPRIKPEDVVRLKKLRGLDKPWYVQYVRWIWGYNDPRRPASLSGLDGVALQLGPDGKASLEADLIDGLHDPDFRHGLGDFLDAVRAEDEGIAGALEAMPEVGKDEAMQKLGEELYKLSPSVHSASGARLRKKAASSVKLEGLWGLSSEGAKITRTYERPGLYSEWFIATDSDGYQTVGRLPVFVAPPPAPEEPAPKDPEAPEELDEQAQQMAGGTEQPEPKEPTEAELIDMARAASEQTGQGTFLIAHIPSQVVDLPESFQVDLKEFVVGVDDAARTQVKFQLLDSPGTVDGGVYKHVYDGPGQSAVRFSAAAPDGRKAFGAFSVEHGPIADKEKFNRGFLYVFAGDEEALGFSNTYKRPVYEILAGVQPICGDGQIGPGETCDDGNLEPGDGCDEICHDESLSYWQKLDARAAGWLITSGRVFNTVQLMLPAILFSLIIAIPLGVLAAYKQYSWIDYVSNFWAFVGISLPVFWFAIMVLALMSEKLQLLPAGGIQTPGVEGGFFGVLSDRMIHTLQPAFVLSIAYTGRWLRYMRASMLEVLPLDFIRTARAKGLRERVVILKHALRNALIPVVTVLALSIPSLFGGAILTETVFAWPGVGRLQYDSVMNNDYYVAIVVFLISSGLLMLGNLLADVMYVIVDPRIRKS
jgi:cysteine-rich repeat protein